MCVPVPHRQPVSWGRSPLVMVFAEALQRRFEVHLIHHPFQLLVFRVALRFRVRDPLPQARKLRFLIVELFRVTLQQGFFFRASPQRLHVFAQSPLVVHDPVNVLLPVFHFLLQLRDGGLLRRNFLQRVRHLRRDASLFRKIENLVVRQIRDLIRREERMNFFHRQHGSCIRSHFHPESACPRRLLFRLLRIFQKIPSHACRMLDHQHPRRRVLIAHRVRSALLFLAHLRQRAFVHLHFRHVLRRRILLRLDQQSQIRRVRKQPFLARLDRVGQSFTRKHFAFEHVETAAVQRQRTSVFHPDSPQWPPGAIRSAPQRNFLRFHVRLYNRDQRRLIFLQRHAVLQFVLKQIAESLPARRRASHLPSFCNRIRWRRWGQSNLGGKPTHSRIVPTVQRKVCNAGAVCNRQLTCVLNSVDNL